MQTSACRSAWLAAVLSAETLVKSLSACADQIIGYSAQELVGKPLTLILSDSSAFEVPGILDRVKKWGYWEGEIEHKTRGGGLLKARGIFLSLAEGGNQGRYLLMSSLSKSAVLAERERPAVAEIAANLRALVHDLNNPLAVLMGFAQLLVVNAKCEDSIRNDIEKLYSELKRVIQVVERLHEYALSLQEGPRSDRASNASIRSA
jgi:nitrogen-specific signal transduction histidine kinase